MLNAKLFASRVRAAIKTDDSLSEKCRQLAEMIAAEHNPLAPPKTEFERLKTLATDALKPAKIPASRARDNVMSRTYQYMLAYMFPTEIIEIAEGKGKNSAVTKKAEDCMGSTREIQKAATQIKENLGISDGRASNGKKPKAGTGFDPAVLQPWVKADIKAAVGELTRILAAFGYRVEKIRHTSPPIKKPRAQAETRRPPAEQPAEQPAV
jgi:hypothetical protein